MSDCDVSKMEELMTQEQVGYQVGQIDMQSDRDPIFTDYSQAVESAKTGSWTDSVWAVWRLPEGDIEVLVYQQTVYVPS